MSGVSGAGNAAGCGTMPDMSEHRNVPARLVDAALEASPMLERFYVAGGGSKDDLRTDLSHALAAAILFGSTGGTPWSDDLAGKREERRLAQRAYTGPDRRRARVGL